MDIALSPDLEHFIVEQVRAGEFRSASEAVDAAVRLLQRQEQRRASLCREISVGVEQLNTGQFSEHDDAGLDDFFAGIKAEGRARLAK